MRCLVCDTDNPDDARVCAGCKAALRLETIRAWPPPGGSGAGAVVGVVDVPLAPSARTEGAAAATDGDDDARFAPGRLVLGTYTIERQVGRGGMGAVYLARDDVSGQRVAVKVLPGSLARERNVRERFIQEARSLAALDHPGIVPLITFAQDGDDRYLVMKYVEGRPLEHLIRAQRVLAPAEALRILRETCLALDYAHGRGVVHRDIKPANVLIDDRGRVVVVDFGIARKLEGEKRLTQTGMLMGTPQYMAPEQIDGQQVDGRCDLYACGLLLFEMLAGRPPFDGERTFDILRAHVERPVPDVGELRRRTAPDAAPIPDDVVALVSALLQKDPFNRPKNGAAVVDIIDGRVKLAPSTQAVTAVVAAPLHPRAAPVTTQTPALALDPRDDSLVVPRFDPGARIAAALALVAVAGVAIFFYKAGLAQPVGTDAGVVVDANEANVVETAGLVVRARRALAEGRLEDARFSIDTALEIDHDNVEALVLRAEILVAGNNPTAASETLARLPAALGDELARRRDDVVKRIDAMRAEAAPVETPKEKPRTRSTPKPETTATPKPETTATSTRPRPSQLSDADLRAVTAATGTRVQGCWVGEVLARDRGARGEVALAVTVHNDGSVVDVKVKKSAFVNEPFHTCLVDAASTWRFPAFDGDDDVILHRFAFVAEETDAQ